MLRPQLDLRRRSDTDAPPVCEFCSRIDERGAMVYFSVRVFILALFFC